MEKLRVKFDFVPRPHQVQAHKNRKRFSVLVWHRRGGKTVFSVMELCLDSLATKKKDGRFAYIAPYYGQGKAVAWPYLKRYAQQIPGSQIREGDLKVIFPNGSEIKIYGADNPDSLRGLYFDGVVLDEVADMKPNVWGEIIRPALTDRKGWALFIGTPKGVNLFSEIYNFACKNPDWYADLKRWKDTGAVPEEEIEQARKEMAPPIFAQEFECDFSAAVANIFIPLELALQATQRGLSAVQYEYAPKVIGGDVARFGDDRSVMFPRQGLQAFLPKVYRGINLMEYTNNLIHLHQEEKSEMTFVDAIGIGAGVVDRIAELNLPGFMAVDSGAKAPQPKFKNMRSFMWDSMKTWLLKGGCLPDDPLIHTELITDLCAPMYWYDEANRLCIESGEQMKKRGLRSPDLAAGLYLTFAAPVVKMSEVQRYSRNTGKLVSEYDVLG